MVTKATPAKKRATKPRQAAASKKTTAGTRPGPAGGDKAVNEAIKAASAWLPDFADVLKQLNVPGVDLEKLLASRRRDIEAVVAAHQEVYQGMQALAKRQAELAQETMSQWQAAVLGGGMGRVDDPLGPRAAAAQEALGKALANLRELAQLASQSQARIFKLLQDRSAENLEEMRQLMKKA